MSASTETPVQLLSTSGVVGVVCAARDRVMHLAVHVAGLDVQVAAAAQPTLAEKVINTLKSIGAPGMLVSGQRSIDAINALLEAAEHEKARIISPDPDAELWRYVAQHTVVIDSSTEGMLTLTIAKGADSGACELAAAKAVAMLADPEKV